MRATFLWHMHQPDYRDPETGEFVMPWVRLHAARAYRDMAEALLRRPGVKAAVNFSGVLLDQLSDYANGRANDRWLALSRRAAVELSPAERVFILRSFFMVDWESCVRPVPRYWELLHKRGRELSRVNLAEAAAGFTPGELRDLQVHFNLAWLGFTAREDPAVRALIDKGRDYGEDEKNALLEVQLRVVREIVPRWKELQDRGQVEITATPFYHPILPLLVDSDVARVAMPRVHLPPRFSHPEDARVHVERALAIAEDRFDKRPRGMWPAEGSVSPGALRILGEAGVSWCATDEGVLFRSLAPGAPRGALYRPYRHAGVGMGFAYAQNPAEAAAEDLMSLIRACAHAPGAPPARDLVVPVILDGENPWERYPGSGRDFLDALYRRLEEAKDVQTVLPGDALDGAQDLPRLHSGSWIDSDFHIWIGHPEDNLAWAELQRARHDLGPSEHLYAAEGSDWFWWFGDEFQTESWEDFDALFRGRILAAYREKGRDPPERLHHPIKHPPGLAVRVASPTAFLSPELDGRATGYYEWAGAGAYVAAGAPGSGGAMHGGAPEFERLLFGFDMARLYLRLDPAPGPGGAPDRRARPDELRIALGVGEGDAAREVALEVKVGADGALVARPASGGAPLGEGRFGDIVELALPFAALGVSGGQMLRIAVRVLRGGVEVDRLPRYGHLRLRAPDADFELENWRV
jgi:alpha-amylase/alpha-mannosidase (GH57 family)